MTTTTTRLEILDPDHPDREALRRELAAVYGAAFGAEPGHLHDRLLALRDGRERVLGLIGATRACDREPLFVEQYLDVPAEALWSLRLGRDVGRHELVEVGNLAARRPGFGSWLVTALAQHLVAHGSPLTVFAATTPLRGFFAHLGVPLGDHGPADPARLGAEAARWGRYYATAPRVCTLHAGDLLRAGTALGERRAALAQVLDAARRPTDWRRTA